MKKKGISLLFILLIAGVAFCQSANAKGPGYKLIWENLDKNGKSESKNYVVAAGTMRNISGKTIKSCKLVYSLYDKKGNLFENRGIMRSENIDWPSDTFMTFALEYKPLEKIFKKKIGYIDFIFFSEIVYEDGTEWHDPDGVLYFLEEMKTASTEQALKLLEYVQAH